MAPFNGTVKTVDSLSVFDTDGTAVGAWDLF
jgi:hypothetical protein